MNLQSRLQNWRELLLKAILRKSESSHVQKPLGCPEQWSLVSQASQFMAANCPDVSAMQSPQRGSQFIHMQCERDISVVSRNVKWGHLILLKKQITEG